jgi:plastocyanin
VSWLAILLSLAALGGTPAPGAKPTLKQCDKLTTAVARQQCRKAAKAKPRKPKPKPPGKPVTGAPPANGTGAPAPTPTAVASPTPTATPTPSPVHPSRTGVDLVDGEEWTVRPSYRILAAGRLDFVATNVGEDDHDLSVRQGAHVLGRLALAPGESETLTLDLAAGTYTLYCSLTGHEEAGMRANISIR